MRCVVHGPQAIDRDVRINLSGIQTRMTKQRLQRADIRSILQHQRSGRRMASKLGVSLTKLGLEALRSRLKFLQ